MAPIPGTIRVTAPIAPSDSTDVYASHLSEYGKGSWHEVADLTARDAITTDRRTQGMAVWVLSEQKLYVLETGVTNLDWVEFSPTPSAHIEQLTITSDEQTSFTLSNVPIGIFGVVLNGITYVQLGTDFSVFGSILTWLNPGGVTMNVGNTAFIIYNFSMTSVLKYLRIQIGLGTMNTSNILAPFNSVSTNATSTILVAASFTVPQDLSSIYSLIFSGFTGSAAGGSYDFNIKIAYCDDGDLSTDHSSTYIVTKDFTLIAANTWLNSLFDLTSLVSGIMVPGRRIGIGITSDLVHQVAVANGTLAYL